MTPQLISVQDFAFRGSLRLALQSTASMNETAGSPAQHNKENEP
ncbi:hypothetical protein [Priestia aryabhattai]